MTSDLIPVKYRAWAYRVCVAVVALCAFYGVVSSESTPLWVGLVTALFGNGLATAYTPKD